MAYKNGYVDGYLTQGGPAPTTVAASYGGPRWYCPACHNRYEDVECPHCARLRQEDNLLLMVL